MTPPDRSQTLAEPDPADYGRHNPDDDPWWQESTLFTWSDPRRGLGAEYRLGIHPARGVANVYTWSIVDGEMIDRRLVRDLPVPDGILDIDVAGLRFRTVEPGRVYDVGLRTGGLATELRWTAFMSPTTMSIRHGSLSTGTGHYNTLGRAAGTLTWDGREYPIDGDGFHDHSWGRRKEPLPGSRWIVAVFDPEFYIMAMPILGSDAKSRMLGYICHGGQLRSLVGDVEMGYTMRDDWITPAACDARLFDEDGRGFRLVGRSIGPSSSQPFPQGKFVTHAQAEFECGGRIGRGLIESTAPRFLSDADREVLCLPTDHFLNAPFTD
jgi:hypothetical protein